MAEETFNIVWIDDTGTSRTNQLHIDDDLCYIRMAEETRVGASKYTLDRIYRYIDWSLLANSPGQVKGNYIGKYRDNDFNEIDELQEKIAIVLNNNFRVDWANWSEKQMMAYAGDKLVQYLFDSKPVFNVDVNNKPNEPLVFTHPTIFDYVVTPNSGGVLTPNGEIKLIPRGGTAPFQFKIDLLPYATISGNSHDITGLATGTYNIRIRDSRAPQVVSKAIDIPVPDASI